MRRGVKLFGLLAVCFILLGHSVVGYARNVNISDKYIRSHTGPGDESGYVPGELIVKLKEGKTLSDINTLKAKHAVTKSERLFNEAGRRHIIDTFKEKIISAKNKKESPRKVKALEKHLDRLQRRQQRATKGIVPPDLSNIYILRVGKNADIPLLAKEYSSNPAVEYAQPNYLTSDDATFPNDPYWLSGSLYGIDNTFCPAAWDLTQGSDEVIVAPIENGIDINHEDFGLEDKNHNGVLDAGEDTNNNGLLDTGNIWINELELYGDPAVDDDSNGCIDDIYGSTWMSDTYCSNTIDTDFHGTHVAGTIAAIGNNGVGVTGMTWRSKIMPSLGYSITGRTRAIKYAADMGADVINNSWKDFSTLPVIKDTIDYAHSLGCVIVASAGNQSAETLSQTPAQVENAITVAAVDSQDHKASFSNYGVKVDVAAPGVDIKSTVPDNSYDNYDGTSMAAPHVAGLAALIISRNLDLHAIDPVTYPLLTTEEIRQIIRKSSDDLVDPLGNGGNYPGFDIFSGYGRINAYQALQYTSACEANITAPEANAVAESYDFLQGDKYYKNGFTAVSGLIDIKGIANCRTFNNYKVEYGYGTDPQNWTLIYSSANPVTGSGADNILVQGFDTDQMGNRPVTVKLTVTNASGGTFEDRLMINVARALITNLPRKNQSLSISEPLMFDKYDIEGFATGAGFLSYHLEYGIGDNPANWIVASPNHTTAVNNGVLFDDFDFMQLPNGTLTLKLVVEDSVAGISEDKLLIENDSISYPYQSGFPISVPDIDLYGFSSPVTADIDNDGQKEIIIGAHENYYTGHLYVFKSNGIKAVTIPFEGPIESSPAVGNLDDDPELEIGIKYMAYNFAYNRYDEHIELINHDGTTLSGWSPLIFDQAEYTCCGEPSVVFYDMDNDGKMEIIFGTSNSATPKIYVYRSNGTPFPGWEGGKSTAFPVAINPVVGDLNKDGSPEIVVKNDNTIYVWNGSGQLLWTKTLDGMDSGYSTIVLADSNNDGYLEIVATHLSLTEVWYEAALYVLNYNGTQLLYKTFPNVSELEAFSIGDIDNDGYPEIVLPGVYTIGGYLFSLNCVEFDGTLCSGNWPVDLGEDNDPYPGSPLIADINGDGTKEILISFYGRIVKEIAAYLPNGTQLTNDYWPLRKLGYHVSSMALDDLDIDGDIELIYRGSAKELRVWDLPYAYQPENVDWPMFQHDAKHTGNFNFRFDGKPELKMTAVSGPASANTGQIITVPFIEKNQGSGNVLASTNTKFYLSSDQNITTGDIYLGSASVHQNYLNGLESYTGYQSLTIPATLASGTYYIGAIADADNTEVEAIEDNNSLAGNTIVITRVYPDLVITAVSGPASANTGQVISVQFTETNQGLGDTLASTNVKFYLSTDQNITTGDTYLGVRSVHQNYLNAGESYPGYQPLTIPATLAGGTYYIGAVADADNTEVEAIENNNSLAGSPIVITRVYPDLVMTTVSGPACGNKGQLITIASTVANQGIGNALASVTVKFYLSSDQNITTGDIYLGSTSVHQNYLRAGNSRSTNTSMIIPGSVVDNTYYIGAIADPSNTEQESDESNNSLSGNLIVVPCP